MSSLDTDRPRLNFVPDFIQSILSGSKTATTRIANEIDKNSDLDSITIGEQCWATSNVGHDVDDATPFARINILNIELRTFGSIDQGLATLENCNSPNELRNLLRMFYPNLNDNTILKVIHFKI